MKKIIKDAGSASVDFYQKQTAEKWLNYVLPIVAIAIIVGIIMPSPWVLIILFMGLGNLLLGVIKKQFPLIYFGAILLGGFCLGLLFALGQEPKLP